MIRVLFFLANKDFLKVDEAKRGNAKKGEELASVDSHFYL